MQCYVQYGKIFLVSPGYYAVLCIIWKYIVRFCIVLKTRIGRDAIGESNTGFQYNTDEYNIFPYCT
jgi:hypothetical protein